MEALEVGHLELRKLAQPEQLGKATTAVMGQLTAAVVAVARQPQAVTQRRLRPAGTAEPGLLHQ